MMTEKQQAGKGIILAEVLRRFFGPSGFTPSTTDQVLGRFNDAIRGCAYVFLDEVLFAGARRPLMRLKSLSTATEIGIETKRLPIVKMPGGRQLVTDEQPRRRRFMSRSTNERYWVLRPSERRVGDAPYFAALAKEIENGGREAFADYLLNLDVSDFVPSRDVKEG